MKWLWLDRHINVRQSTFTIFPRFPSPQKRPGSWFLPPPRESPQYACFPLTHTDWDCNTIEGKRRPFVHRPSLLAGLKVATRWPTNLSGVNNIRQRENKSPTEFWDRVMETFLTVHTHGPRITRSKGSSGLSFCQSGNTSYGDKAPEGGVVRTELSKRFKDSGKESI